uniref:Uncharacterized protein n=1 Tax=Knipowitschia caucasica TaxID=637954 RepID=A0AAV2KVX2_KNICA
MRSTHGRDHRRHGHVHVISPTERPHTVYDPPVPLCEGAPRSALSPVHGPSSLAFNPCLLFLSEGVQITDENQDTLQANHHKVYCSDTWAV